MCPSELNEALLYEEHGEFLQDDLTTHPLGRYGPSIGQTFDRLTTFHSENVDHESALVVGQSSPLVCEDTFGRGKSPLKNPRNLKVVQLEKGKSGITRIKEDDDTFHKVSPVGSGFGRGRGKRRTTGNNPGITTSIRETIGNPYQLEQTEPPDEMTRQSGVDLAGKLKAVKVDEMSKKLQSLKMPLVENGGHRNELIQVQDQESSKSSEGHRGEPEKEVNAARPAKRPVGIASVAELLGPLPGSKSRVSPEHGTSTPSHQQNSPKLEEPERRGKQKKKKGRR